MNMLAETGNYRSRLIWLVAISTIFRLILASSMELGNSEVYYWVLSHDLELNYFDHPPMVAWLIRLTTLNNVFNAEVLVRLGAVLSCALCMVLIFRLGTVIKDARAGWYAAILYTASIYTELGIGAFILPDSPQMIFWLASLLIFIDIMKSQTKGKALSLLWCFLGLSIGLCIMCKVHGVVLWFGILSYIAIYDRKYMRSKDLYLALLITFLIVSPILIWNIQNHFISYTFHSDRLNIKEGAFDAWAFVKALYLVIFTTNPVNYFLIIGSIVLVFKSKLAMDIKYTRLLLLCSLPLVLVTVVLSMFKETLPHWAGPAYSVLLILPAVTLSVKSDKNGKTKLLPGVLKWAIVCMLIISVVQPLIINKFPGTLSAQKAGIKFGEGDDTLNLYGWEQTGVQYAALYKSDVSRGLMPAGAPVIVTNWFPAAEIDYYLCRATRQETIGIGNVSDLHQYFWLNKLKKPLKPGDDAYLVVPSNVFSYRTFNLVKRSFSYVEKAEVISITRSGIPCKDVYVFRMFGYRGIKSAL